ncbi:MAG: GNAT family N-acetyltransferase [Brevundimonas sp.]|uniref:GNAT family N-acetyltransferase n=1 Tax=Brevundimonas sp. TaxID=1871086 RepID=UPI002729124C|nr:GNAT family N-acetyltransferase [Brevundimonas sp.]MDO9588096.1 GNAT family N-acetyltransferase [Brevundimonas sp.]MDP3369101.1 GNAT family N-acetyltransferase [Brevundimonas sp.]MDP3656856.1 GNAT family N-acetyltransferase [Brevundimonas sp.]MDZ4112293.1 GNAT family N-acetyltransferase [Brevundimonas sp.]
MTGPVLETERLTLRPVALEDFPRWAEMMGDAEAAKFLGGAQPAATAWRGFMSMAGAWSLTGISMFSVIERDSGLWLGRIGPWTPHDWPGSEVGWGLHPDAQGRGYGVEAATAAIDYAFDVLGWTEVIHCIDPDNVPSQRLAERLGSYNQGPTQMPAPFQDMPVDKWGQSRAEWRARSRPS